MDEVKEQLVKDVAGLQQGVANLGVQLAQNANILLTEGRVREIVKEELEAAKPPQKRPFGLSSQGKKSPAQTKPREGENAVKS